MDTIVLRYRSVDGYSKKATFKTAAAAKRFIVKWIGADAECGGGYAVSGDGIGVVQFLGGPVGTNIRTLVEG